MYKRKEMKSSNFNPNFKLTFIRQILQADPVGKVQLT